MMPKVRGNDMLFIPSPINYTKLKPNAEDPVKDELKNIVYELTIVERTDNRTEDIIGDVNTFSTCLTVSPPKHYHLEIMQHPSLVKTGYMLAGGPFIIEPDTQEEIIIPLFKFKEAEDLELPFKAAVMVLRQSEYAPINGTALKKSHSDRNDMYSSYREEIPKPQNKRPGVNQKKTKQGFIF